MFELKVVEGGDLLNSPIAKTELEIYSSGLTVKRAKTPRRLHAWAISHGFVFRRDARMLFRGYYRHYRRDVYAAIV